jgi:uncharacterized protein YfeS
MNQTKQVPMMISLPPDARNKLRILAAEQNLRNTNRVTSAATIAREMILEGIEKIESMEAGIKPSDELTENNGFLVQSDQNIQK